MITELEVRRLRHDFTVVIARAIQPALWLLLFGEVFTKVRAISTGDLPYLAFMAPGILAQSVLFVAIFLRHRYLGAGFGHCSQIFSQPDAARALVLGKALSAGVRSLSQAFIIYALGAAACVKMNWSPPALLGVLVTIADGVEETKRIDSGMEKHVRFSSGSRSEPGGGEDQQDRQFTGHLNSYYMR